MDRLVPEIPTRAANVLLSCSAIEADDEAACAELLAPALVADGAVLWVTYTRTPQTCVDTVAAVDGTARGVVLTVGEPRHATDAVAASVDVETVENPTDLTGLGIALREQLEAVDVEPLAVCFDSVTALLQYVDLETAYEFLHVLAGQVAAIDARAHYHVDPAAHDEQTLATLAALADGAVEVRAEGVSLRSRYAP